jgi:hypothetical protein
MAKKPSPRLEPGGYFNPEAVDWVLAAFERATDAELEAASKGEEDEKASS